VRKAAAAPKAASPKAPKAASPTRATEPKPVADVPEISAAESAPSVIERMDGAATAPHVSVAG
jgi:hypothetical protein